MAAILKGDTTVLPKEKHLLSQLTQHPMFLDLKKTLADDISKMESPFTVLPNKAKENKGLDEGELLDEFSNLSSLKNSKVSELETFYQTQSVTIETQRSDALSGLKVGKTNFGETESEVNKHFNEQTHHLVTRVSQSLELLKSSFALSGKEQKKSRQLNSRAIEIMSKWYEKHTDQPYPTEEQKQKMADEGGITIAQVKAWFANKRNRTFNTRPKRQQRQLEQKLNSICKDMIHEGHGKQYNMLDNIFDQISDIVQDKTSSVQHSIRYTAAGTKLPVARNLNAQYDMTFYSSNVNQYMNTM
ncbi:unnamed protein product [Owenia fusiformis]|uniref:Uncharacterized protein n=1 Tax=Owenia fusiformis TaxID=6347 RepID=A0A8J1UTM8_OWEFU|nr:unnamed protein product [Owenia fusiformis]